MRKTMTVTAALLSASAPFHADAQKYPQKPIQVIAPVAAGTSADTAARIITKKMGELLGQQLVIENRGGALGELGVRKLLEARPDGYTICFCNDGSVITVPARYLAAGKEPPYLPGKDLTAIGRAVEIYYVLIGRKGLQQKTLRDIVEFAREHPGKLTIASASPMGTIITGLLKTLMGPGSFVEVPYVGEPQAVPDLLSGRIDLMPTTSFTALPQIATGTVEAIGTVGKRRNPFIPNLPTLQELSPEFGKFYESVGQLMPWNGLLGPQGIPEDVVATLNNALKKALEDPKVAAALAKAKLEVRYSTPEGMTKLFGRLPVLTKVMKGSGTGTEK